MNVYVAGAYHERTRVRYIMDAVVGHPDLTLAHDWVSIIDEVPGGDQSREAEMSPEMRARHARTDLDHVLGTDVFWFLVPAAGGRGCWFEAGYACYAMSNPLGNRVTITSGPHHTVSIFTELFDYKFADDAEAFDFIVRRGWT